MQDSNNRVGVVDVVDAAVMADLNRKHWRQVRALVRRKRRWKQWLNSRWNVLIAQSAVVIVRNANGVIGLSAVVIVRNVQEIARNVAAANVVSSNLHSRLSLIC